MDTNEKFNSIEKTNDEYLAVIQSRDPNIQPNLDDQIVSDNSKRVNDFLRRYGPIDTGTFEANRNAHMWNLFNAYKSERSGSGATPLMHLNSSTATDIDSVRRVIGSTAGRAYYDGPMYLDPETIAAVCHLASVSTHIDYGMNRDAVNYGSLPQIINEMIATKNIFLANSELGHLTVPMLTGSAIYGQTSIAERAVEHSVGRFCFDKIQHSETAHDFANRKTNIFSKVAAKFKTFFENSQEPSRFGPALGEQTNIQKQSQEMGGR